MADHDDDGIDHYDNEDRPMPPVRTRTRPKVGYCSPPVHTRFKPGQSGNPRGRRKGARGLKTIVQEIMSEKVAIRSNGKERKVTRLEVLVLKQVELAGKGDLRALDKLIQLHLSLVPDAEAPADDTFEPTQTDQEVLNEYILMCGGKLPDVQEGGS